MHARAVAVTTTALLGALMLSTASEARAAGGRERPLVVAHRGASAHAPENTLPAIDRAAALGFRWVENDVQRTKDGELVVLHDDSLRRTTNVEQVFPDRAPWKVKDFTAAEIARLDAGSWFSPAYAGTRVPTLDQYLRRVEHHHEKLLLEIKNPGLYPGIERQTLGVLGARGWLDRRHLESRLIVQSFSADSVRVVHDLAPGVRTAFLGRPAEGELARYAGFADLINPSHGTLSAGYVTAVHAVTGPHGKPLKVFAWTVDDASRARALAGYGVDGIITDRPDVVRTALRAAETPAAASLAG
ncbi:glycerophosphodiester phosphodiesterase [Streptomyces sp. NPDC003393]